MHEEVGIYNEGSIPLRIYPNPSYSQVTIETGRNDVFSLEIVSINGTRLLDEKFEGPTRSLDLTSFESGVYFITIRSKDVVTIRKIVKM